MAITDGLTHDWLLGEASGTRADSTGTDDLDTIIGSDAPAVTGNLGQAADLTGDLIALQVASNVDLSAADTFSVSVWWHQVGGLVGNRRIAYLATGTARAFMISVNSAANRPFAQYVTDPSGNLFVVPDAAFGPTIRDYQWNHFVCTYNRDDVAQVYTNNRLAATETTPDEPLITVSTTPTWTLGGNQAGVDRGNVLIQRVMIWNRVITAAEVTELFNFGAGLYHESALLTTHRQTELARREVMETGFEGVVIHRLGIDNFVWFDRRVIGEARERPVFRELVGPMSGNWRAARAYLDPRGTVLTEVPA